MIRGITKNIALMPQGYKDLNPEETFMPYQIDLRNGRATDAGNWEKRNGFAEWRDTGIDKSIDLLIPINDGYAITSTGKVFTLEVTPAELTGQNLAINNRPQWDIHNDLIIICAGGNPVKIENSDIALLGGSPPQAKFMARISSYLLMAGHDATEFKWSASGNPENWTTGDSGFANVKEDGGSIQMLKMHEEMAYFFKDTNIECWYNRGGDTPFVRLNNYCVWDASTEAGYSVVKANNTLYWFDKDGDFKVLAGNKGQVISKSYRAYFDDKIKNPTEVYGFDCRKENSIRWFSQTDGICIKFDYLKNQMSEDNTWAHGQFERLNWNSYMELDNEQYFGDYEPTGKVYHWSKDYKDDNGGCIRTYRRFKVKLTENGHNARVNRLRFAFKRGIGTPTYTDPKATFRVKFDNNIQWETAEIIDLGAVGDIEPYQDFDSIGIGREMEIEIYDADSTDYLLRDIYLTTQELGI